MNLLHEAVQALAGRCNYAMSWDGQGFNKFDADFGHRLAELASWSPRQYEAAYKMAHKYQAQLERLGIRWADIPPTLPVTPAPAGADNPRRVLMRGESAILRFPYDPHLVSLVKSLPGRRFDNASKQWTVPLASLTPPVLDRLTAAGLTPDPALLTQQAAAAALASCEAAEPARELQSLQAAVDVGAVLPGPRRITLRAHQQEAVSQLLAARRAVLAHDMGLGKSLTALVAAGAFARAVDCAVFVICPVSLRENWRREAAEAGVPVEIFSWAKIPDPLESRPYIVIADEAHYAQTLKSQRTQRFLTLADKARAVFCLSGTPIKNGRPANLFPLLLACKHPLSKNRRAYEVRYCAAGPTRWTPWDTSGAAHLSELHEQTRDTVLRRTKTECLDLPPKTRVLRRAELEGDAKSTYHATFERLREAYQARRRAGEIEGEGEALVMLTHLRHAASIAKVGAAVSLAEEVIEQGDSPILFTEFADSARAIADRLPGAVLLTGDTPQDERQGLVDRFQARQTPAFVGTIQTGGLGLTLTASATVILVDRPWTPGDAMQAEDRAHRIGQTANVLAVWLQCNRVDEKIDGVLLDKYERIQTVLTGQADRLNLGDSPTFFRDLLKSIFANNRGWLTPAP